MSKKIDAIIKILDFTINETLSNGAGPDAKNIPALNLFQ